LKKELREDKLCSLISFNDYFSPDLTRQLILLYSILSFSGYVHRFSGNDRIQKRKIIILLIYST